MRQIRFLLSRPAAQQVVAGSLDIDGLDGSDLVNLVSSSPSTRWNLSVANANESVTWVDVSDSEVLLNNVTGTTSIDNSNNDTGEGSPMWVITGTISGGGGVVLCLG